MSQDVGEQFLAHYGVLGMKWGKRKNRAPESDDSAKARASKKTAKTSGIRALSNSELKALTTRMQLEKSFKDLSKTEKSAGAKYVEQLLMNTGKQVASQVISNYASSAIKGVMEGGTKK